MNIRCPHCQNAIDLVDGPLADLVTCPLCGSSVSLIEAATTTRPFPMLKALGRFELIEHLGAGRFGDVWKARDKNLERFVALKIPRKASGDGSDLQFFLREARAAGALQHPNIVAVHEVGQENSQPYIVSDLVDGPNLAEWMANNTVTFQQTATMCATLAEALDHAHSHKVIHRDLKPSNILIDASLQPRLTDFGLAKRDGADFTLTVDGRVLGTPAYMPPEQARGDAHASDARSDVFSLGVILYEMLAGKRPFQGNSKMVMIQQIIHQDPPPPRKFRPTVPRDLETICLKALEKEPGKRYQTAAEMAADLRRYLAGEPIKARPISRAERAWRWSKRNPVLAGVSSLAALALVALAAVAMTAGVDPDDLAEKRLITLETKPSGATVVFHPLNEFTGEPMPEKRIEAGTSPIRKAMKPGQYLVVAFKEGAGFHEVFRTVPKRGELSGGYAHNHWSIDQNGVAELAKITLFGDEAAAGMALVPTVERMQVGSAGIEDAPPHFRRVPAFRLDPTEVTRQAYSALRQQQPAPPEEMNLWPQTGITPDDAIAVAEELGKRLPDEFEYESAATAGGTRKFPWGDPPAIADQWELGPVGGSAHDVLDSVVPPVKGLFSNAAEFSASWGAPYPRDGEQARLASAPLMRIVRGMPVQQQAGAPIDWQSAETDPRARTALLLGQSNEQAGLRCARSLKPRLLPEDFGRVIR